MGKIVTQNKSQVRVYNSNNYGSTNTKIRRFSNVLDNYGSSITYADDAALGASFTINEAGIYAVTFSDAGPSQMDMGLSLNTTTPTTNIGTIAVTEKLVLTVSGAAASGPGCCAWTGFLSQGDVVRAHTNGVTGGTVAFCTFTICRIG